MIAASDAIVRLYSGAAALLGVAMILGARPLMVGWQRAGNPFFAGSIGGWLMTFAIWWTRLVGLAFVVAGAAGIIDPSLQST